MLPCFQPAQVLCMTLPLKFKWWRFPELPYNGASKKKAVTRDRRVEYLTGAPYLGPGGCRADPYLYKLIPAKQKSIFTEVPLPAGDQKQPQFYALCCTESWLKLLGSLCTSAGFFLKQTFWSHFRVK